MITRLKMRPREYVIYNVSVYGTPQLEPVTTLYAAAWDPGLLISFKTLVY